MSQDLNHVTIIGRLGRDPEMNPAATVCKLRIASSDRVKRGDEWQDHTNWFDVAVFGKTAEHCTKYLSKGRQVAVEGRLRYREWEKDGAKRSAVEIVADTVQFLGPKTEQADTWDAAAKRNGFVGEPVAEDDDIPF
jgi:single-strand DNA-binding protein